MSLGGGEGEVDHSFLGRDGLGDRESAFGAIDFGGAVAFASSSLLSSSSLSSSEDEEDEDEDEEEDAIDLVRTAWGTGTEEECVGMVTFRPAVGTISSLSDDEDEEDEDSSSTRLRFLLRARLGGIVV